MTIFRALYTIVCLTLLSGCDPGHRGKTVLNNQTSYPIKLTYSTYFIKDTIILLNPFSVTEVFDFGGLGAGKDYNCCLCEFEKISLATVDTLKVISKSINDSKNWLISNGNKKRFSHQEITCSFLIEPQDVH